MSQEVNRPERPQLDWLAVIFDRTCPGSPHWSDARSLQYTPPEEKDDHLPNRPAYTDYNVEVREGLARALLETFGTSETLIHVSWFVDGPAEGLAVPDWIQPPLTVAGAFAACPAAVAAQHLRACTYAPGLDLGDPVGDALRLATNALPAPPCRAAVLLVGNSPPDAPIEGDSPLLELLNFRSRRTTTRRRDQLFLPSLRELARREVPAAYLFLTHDRCLPGEEDNLFLYRELQTCVAAALGHHLPVVLASAEAEGIQRGLAGLMGGAWKAGL